MKDQRLNRIGVLYALGAAMLFGGSTPFSKLVLAQVHPVLLAGMLYLSSAFALGLFLLFSRLKSDENRETGLKRQDLRWLAGATFFGGVVGPILLLWGLSITPSSSASLLLNLEGVFSALVAWFVFKENFDRRIAIGMAAITVGCVILSWADARNSVRHGDRLPLLARAWRGQSTTI